MASTIHSIVFDCADPVRLAHFWMAALRYVVEPGSEVDAEGAALIDPAAHGPRLLFNPVPEGKVVKNRLHLDLAPHDTMERETGRLIALGAALLRVFHEAHGTWTVPLGRADVEYTAS